MKEVYLGVADAVICGLPCAFVESRIRALFIANLWKIYYPRNILIRLKDFPIARAAYDSTTKKSVFTRRNVKEPSDVTAFMGAAEMYLTLCLCQYNLRFEREADTAPTSLYKDNEG